MSAGLVGSDCKILEYTSQGGAICCLSASRSSLCISAGGEVPASWLCMLMVGDGAGLLASLLCPFYALPTCCFLHRIIAFVFRRHGIYCDISVIQKE